MPSPVQLSRRQFVTRIAGTGLAAVVSPRSLPAPSASAAPPAAARFIWCDEAGFGRNVFSHFRLAFRLEAAPAAARLHLFADTRYRLRVNGAIAGYGPAAFLVAYPEFDAVDLAPLLRAGDNEIAVEVNSRGEISFQAEPSRGGFIAWGEARAADGRTLADFATPGAWQARRADGWEPQAPTFSFAMGPVEMVDLNRLPPDGRMVDAGAAGWSPPVVAVSGAKWGALAPRSVPPPTLEIWRPQRLATLAPLASREAYVSAAKRFETPDRFTPHAHTFAYAVWLHSPADRTVELSLTPGDHWLNGTKLKTAGGNSRIMRTQATTGLRAGWNLLYGEFRARDGSWGAIVGWPRAAGLRAAARPGDDTGPARMLLTAALPQAELHGRRGAVPANTADLARLGDLLRPAAGDWGTEFPAREFAWDEPVAAKVDEPGRLDGRAIPLSAAGEGTAVIDFGREFIGHFLLEIDAPAGGVLDVANDELLRPDGALRIFLSNPLINSVDRLRLRPGVNRWESFHARGGRYLQLTVRSAGPVTLRRVALRSELVAVPATGRFECSEPIFNWTWQAGVETLRASLTDGWVDPWREQGLYIGDVIVEYLAHRAWTRDTTHIVRALRLWARSQLPDGQLQAVAPAWFRRPHPDYTLLWIVLLRDYARHTGDRALVRELWPCVERIWQSPLWRPGPGGLWAAEGLRVFGDWGATEASVNGDANGILNAFRVGALEAAAQLAALAGDAPRAESLRRERDAVAQAYRDILWDPVKNAFAPCLKDGRPAATSAAHANALALLYRIPTPGQEPGALAEVRRCIAAAGAAPEKCSARDGHYELYFLHFVLEMLADRGLHAEAEAVIRRFWGLQHDHRAWTLWEAFYRGLIGVNSLCHGWAAGPNVFFHRTVLGIDATPEHVAVVPAAAGLTRARGVHPHPRGDVRVDWRVAGDEFILDVELPPGLTHDVRPGAPFARLRPRVTVNARRP